MSDVIEDFLQRQGIYYYTLASFVICFYDYFLTLEDEIRHFWRRKKGITTFLFFLNRYTQVVGTIPIVVLTFARIPDSVSECKLLQPYHHYFVLLTQIMASFVLILRTYALFEKSRRILYLLGALWVIGAGLAVWTVQSPSTPVISEVDPLFPNKCLEPSLVGWRLAMSWIVVFVFDSVVFGLTLFKLFGSNSTNNGRLVTRIVRDGAAYYAVLGIVYLSNIITCFASPPVLQDISVWFANAISGTLMTRLLLNLRNCAVEETRSVVPGATVGFSLLPINFAVVSANETDSSTTSIAVNTKKMLF